ncbi:outer membrane beta-barrel protein [candidate division KSB1 bacterium]|nr:outer membrane beta-barrel protein [candidate division KSB1 bacterium]
MKKLLLLVFALAATTVFAQNTLDNIHLFQGFFHDATITKAPYGDAGFQYADYDNASSWGLGVKGGYGINPKLEVGGGISFLNYSNDIVDKSESGISDLLVTGRYLLSTGATKMAAGGYVTLPIGSEDIAQGNLNFGFFGATRHPLSNGMVIVGTVGLDFVETKESDFDAKTGKYEEKTNHDSSILIGGGAIYPVNKQLNVIGELHLKTEGDYMLLSGGADYVLQSGGHVRGALGLGLDDRAPDLLLMASYLLSF